MLDTIIRNALDIVGRTERLLEASRRLQDSEGLDEIEVYELDHEIERLGDAVFVVDEAIRSLARAVDCWPEAARAYEMRGTLH
ncbi:hypothetical protein GGE16_004562 [Rhizobium leguminosarum]|uniref:Uncharacterized protein n=1 Tax=Rhizobium leguminosarum TaxID=384 RepID=A0AAE2SZB8_RHILE|nr:MULTISPECIES: hypothetical protein [Rhizobium]MBB4292483.1 hypothetical protein [Rhizobium leguminosarum]MBB4298722.1 hypothetical protein [Rhizobium leguminosarum]MBB4310305.1 hypothetical protein [Rhizobium leguminosarum]MBB4434567.1 hypothetical protein [Rhizobium esperanzae]MBB4531463.1 hypothetical protein [Rhizobium leguminosarum]